MHPKASSEKLVVVIAGAGARGAYEAGALSYILPKLAPAGLGSTIFLGTSAGAINAALWASRALPGKALSDVGEEVKATWRSIHQDRVFVQPIKTLPRTALQYASGLLAPLLDAPSAALRARLPRLLRGLLDGGATRFAEISSLLDTSPLTQTASEVQLTDQIRRNVARGAVGGVGVVATTSPMDGSGGRSRIFIDIEDDVPGYDPDSSVDFVRTALRDEHVLASAAIPVAFPAIEIMQPDDSRGWYLDGGVRLNAPIEPAVKLGATKLLVISSHATTYPIPPAISREQPDALDVAAQSVHSVLADGMIEDLRTLERMNRAVVEAERQGARLHARNGRAYRKIDVITVSPPNGTLSPLAAEVLGKLDLRQRFNHWLLSWLMSGAGRGAGNNELLSYLLFEPAYFEAQFTLGAQHAQARWQEYCAQLAPSKARGEPVKAGA